MADNPTPPLWATTTWIPKGYIQEDSVPQCPVKEEECTWTSIILSLTLAVAVIPTLKDQADRSSLLERDGILSDQAWAGRGFLELATTR